MQGCTAQTPFYRQFAFCTLPFSTSSYNFSPFFNLQHVNLQHVNPKHIVTIIPQVSISGGNAP
jgi:hypothetical protein